MDRALEILFTVTFSSSSASWSTKRTTSYRTTGRDNVAQHWFVHRLSSLWQFYSQPPLPNFPSLSPTLKQSSVSQHLDLSPPSCPDFQRYLETHLTWWTFQPWSPPTSKSILLPLFTSLRQMKTSLEGSCPQSFRKSQHSLSIPQTLSTIRLQLQQRSIQNFLHTEKTNANSWKGNPLLFLEQIWNTKHLAQLVFTFQFLTRLPTAQHTSFLNTLLLHLVFSSPKGHYLSLP